METSLHRTLKESYGPHAGGRQEVSWLGFRVDAIGADGELVEIQSAALGPLRKLAVVAGVADAHRQAGRGRQAGRPPGTSRRGRPVIAAQSQTRRAG